MTLGFSRDISRCNDLICQTSNRHKVYCTGQILTCKLCPYKTTRKDYFKKHTSSHENSLQCEICDRFFSNESKLKSHKLDAHHIKTKCELCDTSFSSTRARAAHMRAKHAEHVASSESRLREHNEEAHPKEPRWHCSDCQFQCLLKSEMKEHIENEHLEKEQPKKHILGQIVVDKMWDKNLTSNKTLLELIKPVKEELGSRKVPSQTLFDNSQNLWSEFVISTEYFIILTCVKALVAPSVHW